MSKGYFISFEGVDGAGKSTQIKRLKEYFEKNNYQVVLTREPGGTKIGEKIRNLILDPENNEMTAMTEAMLYAASRAQHVEEVIKPAIDAGKVVISDRFIDSSIAYQGYGRGLGDCVNIINSYAVGQYMPDITFLMDVRPNVSTERIDGRQKDRIELEKQEFHDIVYDGYRQLAKQFPDRIITIDASESIEAIADIIKKQTQIFLEKEGRHDIR